MGYVGDRWGRGTVEMPGVMVNLTMTMTGPRGTQEMVIVSVWSHWRQGEPKGSNLIDDLIYCWIENLNRGNSEARQIKAFATKADDLNLTLGLAWWRERRGP